MIPQAIRPVSHRAAHGAGQLAGDVETESGAGLGAAIAQTLEAAEDPLDLVIRDARTAVAHGQLHAITLTAITVAIAITIAGAVAHTGEPVRVLGVATRTGA